jgi:putative PIN family toxin of toxin-antitoxin system
MIKIVIDTNVFLSAIFSNQGASYKLLEFLIHEGKKGKKWNFVSVSSILELQEVVFRAKNRELYHYFTNDELDSLIDSFIYISNKVEINYLWRPFLKDAKDDKILETAFNAGAEFIVTFNKKDFENVEKCFGIKIVSPKELLGVIK